MLSLVDVLDKLNRTLEKIAGDISGELPAVTTSDNGDVLTVVEGKWDKAEAPDGLPAVTADDNGDVLTVVEGSWAKAVPGGGGEPFIIEWYEHDTGTRTAQTCQDTFDAFKAGRPVFFKNMNEGEDQESYSAFTLVSKSGSGDVVSWEAISATASFVGNVDGYWIYAD